MQATSGIVPTAGRIVIYRLRTQDVAEIERKRKGSDGQVRGNAVHIEQAFPMMIVTTHGATPESYVNGKVMLDGDDTYWATSVMVGEGPGTFSWPGQPRLS